MTLSKKLKELIKNGYRITFKPMYERYSVTVGKGADDFTFMFFPSQFNEKEIIEGIESLVERLNRR